MEEGGDRSDFRDQMMQQCVCLRFEQAGRCDLGQNRRYWYLGGAGGGGVRQRGNTTREAGEEGVPRGAEAEVRRRRWGNTGI